MKSARIFLYVSILMSIAMVFSFISCGVGGTARLDGTWTLTTESVSGNDVGNGTYTINFILYEEILGKEFYSGDGDIGGVPYKVSVEKEIDEDLNDDNKDYYLYLYEGDTKSDSILMSGNLRGSSSASGDYEGRSSYAHFATGTFVTTKQ